MSYTNIFFFLFFFAYYINFSLPHNKSDGKNMKVSYISYFRRDKFIRTLTCKHVTLENNFLTN